jgi:hypothetical protein
MKLSERLGAVENNEPAKPAPPAPKQSKPAPAPRPAKAETAEEPAEKPVRAKRVNAGWEGNKKRVRELVLADLGPRPAPSGSAASWRRK